MTTRWFRDTRQANCVFDCPLQPLLVGMVTLHPLAARIARRTGRRENILPAPLAVGGWVFYAKRVGQVNLAVACSQFLLVKQLHSFEMFNQRVLKASGEHGHAVLESFALANCDLVLSEIDILNP